MALSEVVEVQIQAGVASPSRRGFGVPLLMFAHDRWAGSEVRQYRSFGQVAEDFPASELHIRRAAEALFSQRPRPPVIKIGRLAAGAAQVTTISLAAHPTGQAVLGSVISPDGTVRALDVAWDTDAATTATAVASAIAAISGIGASATGAVVTATGEDDGAMYHFDSETLSIFDASADWGIDDALDDALDEDGDFFAVITSSNSPANMDKVARWAAANDRLAFFAPQHTALGTFASGAFPSGPDYPALMANDAAVLLFTKDSRAGVKEAAWAGRMLPFAPGSATYAFKSLRSAGVDTWSATQRATIEGPTHSGNHYTRLAGLDITRPGKTAGGEWIDLVVGFAWLEARIQERIIAAFANEPKIPYTDAGFSRIVAEVRGQLKEAEEAGLIDAGWETSFTPAVEQNPNDRAARVARGIEFEARAQGAIHEVKILGTVTV